MKTSVFGLGYVGCVTAACLAEMGHEVIGVDIDPVKINALQEGRAPFFEPGLSELVGNMVAAGRLQATTDDRSAVQHSDIALICVGTPATSNGFVQLNYLKNVLHNIGRELRQRDRYYVVALRSTVLPSSISQELIPILEACSGKSVGKQIGFVCNPEFLREGSALKDFRDAPWTIIGTSDSHAYESMRMLYKGLPAPVVRTDFRTAVLVKYCSNAFHALTVAFANEVSAFCREMGVDSTEVMRIFCQDNKLNISDRYLKPGFAFGGSCLPKDLKALMSEAGKLGINVPILNSIVLSNEVHLRNCIQKVAESGKRRIGLVGLTFKAGTDDLRESPAVELAERLMGKGFDVLIYEPCIGPGKVYGSNLKFIERSIPHIWKVLAGNLKELFQHSDVVVVTQSLLPEDRNQFRLLRSDQICIDLARTLPAQEVPDKYETLDMVQSREMVAA